MTKMATATATMTISNLDPKFRRMLALVRVACEAIGVHSRQITIKSADEIEIEDFGVSVTRKNGDVNGAPAKVWVVTERYKVFALRSEEHTSELQSLMRISYHVFCLQKQNKT